MCDYRAPATVTVTSINIHLELSTKDGRLLRLRGVEAPRGTTTDKNIPEKARLDLARQIRGRTLSAAIAAQPPDRWGRIPARLYLPASERHPPRRAAALLIGTGLARVDPASEDAACLAELYRLETRARQARAGLWSDPDYAVLDGNRRTAFRPGHAGRIMIVEGKIASVARWRSLAFINFGPRRQDFAVVVPRFARRAFDRAGIALKGLRGRRVRVRGLLSLVRGPRIEIAGPPALEILPDTRKAGWATINSAGADK